MMTKSRIHFPRLTPYIPIMMKLDSMEGKNDHVCGVRASEVIGYKLAYLFQIYMTNAPHPAHAATTTHRKMTTFRILG
jgi:hypothetical protein